ncbi:AAA family ATPase [Acinetobacter radioresistens]|uniref:AAA family ATPase n=1 Tax=Acinetobacter radioresistens TaxID=40216 RepID=UPI00148EBB2F|nr:AAA family ATPase [Acinetobacter radioresistens]
MGHSRSEIFEILKKILRFLLLDNIKDDEKDKKSLNVLNDKLVFLPTYRRIEHDSIDLFSEEISLKEGSILSFGVSDVSSLFNKITDKLNIYAVNSFNKINNRALNDFISGEHEIDYSLDNWIDKDEDYFTKVLERVGKEIDENNKLKLKLIFNSKDSEDKFLLKLIRKMCEIYDNQSRIEDEIVKYINVCNKYLYNKKFIYDKETLKFKILQVKKNGILKDIKLSSLSSGEKQIISIFAKLYLSHLPSIDLENILPDRAKEGYWILFDEPELSLSVDWQEILLPDILASNRCEFIFATTHSPFIFNNNFKYMTTHINECMEELDSE